MRSALAPTRERCASRGCPCRPGGCAPTSSLKPNQRVVCVASSLGGRIVAATCQPTERAASIALHRVAGAIFTSNGDVGIALARLPRHLLAAVRAQARPCGSRSATSGRISEIGADVVDARNRLRLRQRRGDRHRGDGERRHRHQGRTRKLSWRRHDGSGATPAARPCRWPAQHRDAGLPAPVVGARAGRMRAAADRDTRSHHRNGRRRAGRKFIGGILSRARYPP